MSYSCGATPPRVALGKRRLGVAEKLAVSGATTTRSKLSSVKRYLQQAGEACRTATCLVSGAGAYGIEARDRLLSLRRGRWSRDQGRHAPSSTPSINP